MGKLTLADRLPAKKRHPTTHVALVHDAAVVGHGQGRNVIVGTAFLQQELVRRTGVAYDLLGTLSLKNAIADASRRL